MPCNKFAGDPEVEDAKKLAFVLDEVDRHVMDARKHFQLPAPGSSLQFRSGVA